MTRARMKKVRTSIEVWFRVWERVLAWCYLFGRGARRLPLASDDVFSNVDSRTHTPLSMCSMSSPGRGPNRNLESSGRH